MSTQKRKFIRSPSTNMFSHSTRVDKQTNKQSNELTGSHKLLAEGYLKTRSKLGDSKPPPRQLIPQSSIQLSLCCSGKKFP